MMAKVVGQKISDRSTKNEILDAYNTLLVQVSEETPENPTSKEAQAIVEVAASETVEKVTTDVTRLRLSVNAAITEMVEKLTQEAEKLATIQKAIPIAQKQLSDTQQIKLEADKLYQLIAVRQQQQHAFEKEAEAKRKAWDEEQQEYEERTKRDRARSEEEYAYQQAINHKRDAEELAERKRVFEQVLLAEKQKDIQMTNELEELRKMVAQFPADLDKAVKESVGRAVAEAQKEANIAKQLVKQESDAALSIAQLKISSFEEMVRA